MLRHGIILLFLFSFGFVKAQENPLLGHWAVGLDQGGVLLDWSIVSGNTCQGIYIWRSQNGIDFREIGHIPGLCGSVDEPIDYTWLDPEPQQLANNHYRIELGGEGLSSVKSIYVDRLVQSGSLVYPNPSRDGATLIFNRASNAPVEVSIFNAQGQQVWQEMVFEDRMPIPTGLENGTYIYSIGGDQGKETGRFVLLK